MTSNAGISASPVPKQVFPSPSSTASTQLLNSPIRAIDFGRIAYHNFPDYSNDTVKRVTLRPGQVAPAYANFGDVTGDGEEEAMLVMPIQLSGSAIAYYVYIYSLVNERPKPIWQFETGDRADGGIRQLYSENGQLVIELFGKDRVVGGELYKGDEGLCCPRAYTRTKYTWNGKSFQASGSQVLQNPEGNAAPVMPDYSAPSKRK